MADVEGYQFEPADEVVEGDMEVDEDVVVQEQQREEVFIAIC